MSDWQWKEKNGSSGGLLYEPGNWGDIIKCEWLLQIINFINSLESRNSEYLDLFAGMPVYPLSCACVKRLASLPEYFLLKNAVTDFTVREKWPSAARLVLEASDMTVNIYDQDHLRCSEWGPLANNLDLSDGWDFLPLTHNHDYGLLLIDPYDLLADWRGVFEKLVETVKNCPTIMYVYNRSGRSRERLRDYRLFINHLRDREVEAVFGRVSADSFIPDCWHEMFFFPQEIAQLEGYGELKNNLARVSYELQDIVDKSAVFGEL